MRRFIYVRGAFFFILAYHKSPTFSVGVSQSRPKITRTVGHTPHSARVMCMATHETSLRRAWLHPANERPVVRDRKVLWLGAKLCAVFFFIILA